MNFIFDTYIYISLFIFFIILMIELNRTNKNSNFKKSQYNIIFYSTIFIISIIFGLRDESFGSDTPRYLYFIENPYDISVFSILSDQGYIFLVNFFRFFFNFKITSILISFTAIILLFKGYRNICGDRSLFLVPLVLSFFAFIDLNSNLIKTSLSLGCFIFAVSRKRGTYKYIFYTLAIFFHFSSLICLIIYSLRKHFKTKILFFVWIVSNLISYLLSNFITSFISIIDIDFFSKAGILNIINNVDYEVGYKLKFSVFSFLAIVPFLKEIINNKNFYLINYYLIMNSIFILAYNIPYSNRIGILSYIVMPILLYQGFSENKKTSFFMPVLILLFFILSYNIL